MLQESSIWKIGLGSNTVTLDLGSNTVTLDLSSNTVALVLSVYNLIDRAERHDLESRLWLFFPLFSSLLIKEERKKENE